jgi:hypothetical protein
MTYFDRLAIHCAREGVQRLIGDGNRFALRVIFLRRIPGLRQTMVKMLDAHLWDCERHIGVEHVSQPSDGIATT